jgi:hypothetical protein
MLNNSNVRRAVCGMGMPVKGACVCTRMPQFHTLLGGAGKAHFIVLLVMYLTKTGDKFDPPAMLCRTVRLR